MPALHLSNSGMPGLFSALPALDSKVGHDNHPSACRSSYLGLTMSVRHAGRNDEEDELASHCSAAPPVWRCAGGSHSWWHS